MSGHRKRVVALGSLMVVVALIATAFALGGSGKSPSDLTVARPGIAVDNAPAAKELSRATSSAGGKGVSHGVAVASGSSGSVAAPPIPAAADQSATASVGSADLVTGVTATRVVKTGSLDLTVKRGQVQPVIAAIIRLTTQEGGYVSKSRTDNVTGSPSASLTLRMPAANFDETVTGLEKDGHETSLTTNAHDVTGKFVDLSARLSALKRTRSTYLTILGRARTIGSTLSVQERVDEVQQQIEELQGELKVLRNQSTDGTLDVAVSQAGALTVIHHHHKRSGLGKAWHKSINRFARGVDAIVGGLGPLLLALLILGFLAIVGRIGYRGMRRATT